MTASSNGVAPARGVTMRVAFQGDRGAYAETAIAEIWRHPVEQIPVPTFAGALRAVDEGKADACVIPVENSIVGRVEAVSIRGCASGLSDYLLPQLMRV